jgi:hypothetical protein
MHSQSIAAPCAAVDRLFFFLASHLWQRPAALQPLISGLGTGTIREMAVVLDH